MVKSKAHDLPPLALLLCSDAPPEKPPWAVQACQGNIPMATMNNKGSLKAVTLTLTPTHSTQAM